MHIMQHIKQENREFKQGINEGILNKDLNRKISISQNIKKPLVDKLLFGSLKSGGVIKLEIEKGELKFVDTKTKVKA